MGGGGGSVPVGTVLYPHSASARIGSVLLLVPNKIFTYSTIFDCLSFFFNSNIENDMSFLRTVDSTHENRMCPLVEPAKRLAQHHPCLGPSDFNSTQLYCLYLKQV